MTERRLRIGVDVFGLLVAASVGIALAGLTWRLAGDSGARFEASPGAAPRAARPIDIAPLIALAPFGTTGPGAMQMADQTLVLKGIVLAVPHTASSAIVSVGGAPAIAFSVGQQLGTGTIEAIERDHVVIAGAGGRRILAFPDPAASTGGSFATPPTPPASAGPSSPLVLPGPVPGPGGARPPGTGAAGPDPSQLLGNLGATAGPGGYRIGDGIAPPLRLAGLQPGDVIERINGSAVGDAMRDRTLLSSAMTAGAARLDVVRAGQRLTMTVSLR